jgi:hypothetical protein
VGGRRGGRTPTGVAGGRRVAGGRAGGKADKVEDGQLAALHKAMGRLQVR